MTKDLFHDITVKNALDIQTIATDTTTVGEVIDTAGYESCVFGIITGTVTDGDYTIAITESDTSGSGYTAVADSDLIGTEAGASFTADTDDNKVSKIGYKGTKRYVKMSIVSTSTSSGAVIGGYVILGDKRVGPDSTQTN